MVRRLPVRGVPLLRIASHNVNGRLKCLDLHRGDLIRTWHLGPYLHGGLYHRLRQVAQGVPLHAGFHHLEGVAVAAERIECKLPSGDGPEEAAAPFEDWRWPRESS